MHANTTVSQRSAAILLSLECRLTVALHACSLAPLLPCHRNVQSSYEWQSWVRNFHLTIIKHPSSLRKKSEEAISRRASSSALNKSHSRSAADCPPLLLQQIEANCRGGFECPLRTSRGNERNVPDFDWTLTWLSSRTWRWNLIGRWRRMTFNQSPYESCRYG